MTLLETLAAGDVEAAGTGELGMNDLERIEGLFVGQLSPDEMITFERAIADGKARRCYEGVAGSMGLARVRLIR